LTLFYNGKMKQMTSSR